MLTLNFEVPVRLRYPHGIDTDSVILEITNNIIDESEEIVLTTIIDENGPQ